MSATQAMETERLSPSAPARTTPVAPRGGVHILALDAIRGLAILLVMVYHFNQVAPDDPTPVGGTISKLLAEGDRGVDLFFVLSGFLITGILADSRSAGGYFRNFYIRRTLRIFPLYYGVLFLAFVLLPLLDRSGASLYSAAASEQGWLWLYGTNILQAWREDWVFHGFNHFWSLAVEEHFYLIWPLVIFLCTRRQAMVVCVGCIVLAVACRIVLVLGNNPEVAPYVLTPCRLDALAVGALLALAVRGSGGLRSLVPWALGGAVVCGLLLAAAWWWNRVCGWDATGMTIQPTLFVGLFAGLLIWALTVSPTGWAGRLWQSRGLRFFGKYSYGLYVFHYPLIPLTERYFSAEGLATWSGSVFVGKLLYIAGGIAGSVAVALLSWHLYEKHFLKLKDLLGRGRQTDMARADRGRQRSCGVQSKIGMAISWKRPPSAAGFMLQ